MYTVASTTAIAHSDHVLSIVARLHVHLPPSDAATG